MNPKHWPMSPDGDAGTGAGADASTTEQKGKKDEPVVNIGEIVELRKESREAAKKAAALEETVKAQNATLAELLTLVKGKSEPKQEQKAEPKKDDAKPDGGVSALQAKLDAMERAGALKDAIADSGLTLTKEQRELVADLYKAKSPTDVGEWLKTTAAAMGVKPPAAVEQKLDPKTGKTAVVVPNTGAGGVIPPTSTLDNPDPNKWNVEEARALAERDPAEFKKRVERWRKSGGNSNPYRGPRHEAITQGKVR